MSASNLVERLERDVTGTLLDLVRESRAPMIKTDLIKSAKRFQRTR